MQLQAFQAHAGNQADVAEDDVDELGQLAARDLHRVADRRLPALVCWLKALDPSQDVVMDVARRDQLGRELDRLLDGDLPRPLPGFRSLAGDPVDGGEAFAGQL